MKKVYGLTILILLISVFVLVGCAEEDGAGTGETDNPSTDDSTLTIGIGSDMDTFDIHDHASTATEAIHTNMFSYLIKYDSDEEGFIPDLATDWVQIDDEIWEFTLRDDATFHNGDEVTAEDVKFTLERVANDDSLQDHQNYRQIAEVEVIDNHTIHIHTDGPQPSMLNRISRLGSGILPKDYIEENGWDHFLQEPVGSGPYQYVDWILDDRIILEKYDGYFDGSIADWDEVVFRVIPEASTRVGEVLSGDVDLAHNIVTADWERVEENEGTYMTSGPTNRVMMLVLNHRDEYPTSDLRVRQAIELAIDNGAILDNLMDSGGMPTLTPVTPGTFGANDELHDDYRYNLEQAKELMAEAGYQDGFEMTLHASDGRYMQDRETAEVIAGMLSEIGIQVNLDIMEFGSFSDMRAADEQEDAYLIGLGNSMWDASVPLRHITSVVAERHIGYSNEEIDDIYLDAETETDEGLREEMYYNLQEIAKEEVINVMLHQLYDFYAVDDRIHFEPRADQFFRVEEITLNE